MLPNPRCKDCGKELGPVYYHIDDKGPICDSCYNKYCCSLDLIVEHREEPESFRQLKEMVIRYAIHELTKGKTINEIVNDIRQWIDV
jgi:recombinational DNA repair protein (RecF pathway)